MPTHQIHDEKNTVYFVTFTCYNWLSLIELTYTYHYFDKWFSHLNSKKVSLLGYVIMPNHFHGLFFVPESCDQSLNTLVSNGKRFLAYEIIKVLKARNEVTTLTLLEAGVSNAEKSKGSIHKVFRPSFDAKPCFDREMVETKLDYIHHNPVQGKWNLVQDWTEYPYSSAGFYELERPHEFLEHYMDFI
ncbi:MAG: hypothetical protein Roseis2KO_60270 [Roseivirga sp.]